MAGVPAVVLEAMAHGLPLVVCDRGGPGENVSDACAVRVLAESPAQFAQDVAAQFPEPGAKVSA
jgi:glycosyltransferase involved in cell wall biosynthesis